MTADPTNPDIESMWATVVSREEARQGKIDAKKTIITRSPLETFERQTATGLLPRIDADGDLSEFRISRTLGRGGMGLVRLARQTSLWRDVAIKTLLPDQRDAESSQDLLREAWVTGMLEHPNIVPVHVLGLDESGSPMLVMKRVEGVSWEKALKEPDTLPAPLRAGKDHLATHLSILLQLTNALQFAHKNGIIHCDLKPENVMLGEFGEVYLLDWGIAVSIANDGTDRLPLAGDVNEVSGTPSFIAPELAGGEGDKIGPWTDTYLLGAVLHYVITGAPRHSGSTIFSILLNAYQSDPVAYDDAVAPELAAICNKATSQHTSERYQTAQEFRAALVLFLEHRESQRLSDDADERFQQLRQGLSGVQDAPPEALAEETVVALDRLFAESRFGYEQALAIWPDNPRAREGRDRALREMAAFEIFRRDASAAGRHIEELDDVPEALSNSLRTLRDELRRAAEENRRNEAIRRDLDLDLASHQRAKMSVGLGFIFGGVPFLNHALIRMGLTELTFPAYVAQFITILVASGLLVFVMRERLLRNAVNARIITSIFIILAGCAIMRLVGFLLGLEPAGCIALENGLLAFSMFMMAVSVDRRLWTAGFAFLAGAVGGAMNPDWILFWDGGSNAAALWLIAWAWRKPRGEHTTPFTLRLRDGR